MASTENLTKYIGKKGATNTFTTLPFVTNPSTKIADLTGCFLMRKMHEKGLKAKQVKTNHGATEGRHQIQRVPAFILSAKAPSFKDAVQVLWKSDEGDVVKESHGHIYMPCKVPSKPGV